jgi:hypothetical protein
MAAGLVAAIDQLPALLRGALTCEAETPAGRTAAERAVRLLLQVLSLASSEVDRLRLCAVGLPPEDGDPEETIYLRELIGEVKGKHCDALIGATAACIAGDGTDPLQIEHVLFPERSLERRAARAFLGSLRDISSHLDALAKAQPFTSWIAAWRAGRRIDRYALVPLTQLRGDLGTLLDPRNRRALHLPDFYQLCRREARLSEAVGELERLHRKTWRQAFAPVSPETCKALVARTLEVAAILDVESLLAGLIGGERIRGLRDRAEAHGGSGALRQLLRQEDLRTLIGLLRGSMSKRGSLQQRPPAALECPPVVIHSVMATTLPFAQTNH